MVATQLAHNGRKDLAAMTALCFLRAVWAFVHGAEPPPAAGIEMADSARRLFLAYAEEIWTDAQGLEADSLAALNASGGYYSTYRVMNLRLLEILSFAALLDASHRDEIGTWVSRFVATNPGASQPLSDRWAVSVIPATVVLARHNRDEASQYLAWIASWICDHYEDDSLGLAAPDADPVQEVDYFFGGALEHVARPRRRLSYVATVVLDLAAALELSALYDARNDFLAADINLGGPVPRDDDAQY